MQLQETPEMWLFKVWPWIEANRIRLAWGAGIVLVAAGLISFHSWQQQQKEISAGQALTDLMMSDQRATGPAQQADLYIKLAEDHHNTYAAQRAVLEGATLLFGGEKYADAQKQFEQFLEQHPGSSLSAQAALGVAACLEAQGKIDQAVAAYQRVISSYSDITVITFARLSLGQIDERMGKSADALNLYQDVARNSPNSQLGQEAAMRAMELKMKPAASGSTASPSTSFKLSN